MSLSPFLTAIAPHLPLVITRAEFTDPSFCVGGDSWSLGTLSAWRVVSEHTLLFGCEYGDAADLTKALIGKSIVDASAQGQALACDPAFTLDDGSTLEVFSCHYLEPWTVHLPDGSIFVSSPSSP